MYLKLSSRQTLSKTPECCLHFDNKRPERDAISLLFLFASNFKIKSEAATTGMYDIMTYIFGFLSLTQ